MPYVKRTVRCGDVVEVKKMFTGRVHTQGAKRGPRVGSTSDRQKQINARRAEEELRWTINCNFSRGDWHLVLHYYDKQVTMDYARKTLDKFIRKLQRAFRKDGRELRYIACTETKRMTNVHHHILMPACDLQTVQDIWDSIVTGAGNVSIKPLDGRGQHRKLANYLMKETEKTMERAREQGRKICRFKKSRNLRRPEIRYEVVSARSWSREPKAPKGSYLYKFEDGQTARSGVGETGWQWQEYFLIYDTQHEPGGRFVCPGAAAGERGMVCGFDR